MLRWSQSARRHEALRPSTACRERGLPPCRTSTTARGRPGASYVVRCGSVTRVLRSRGGRGWGWGEMCGMCGGRTSVTGDPPSHVVVRRVSVHAHALGGVVGRELVVVDVEEDPHDDR